MYGKKDQDLDCVCTSSPGAGVGHESRHSQDVGGSIGYGGSFRRFAESCGVWRGRLPESSGACRCGSERFYRGFRSSSVVCRLARLTGTAM